MIFFSHAPYIDIAISEAAEMARRFLKRDVAKTVRRGGAQALVSSGAVTPIDGDPSYYGPYWTLGYDYDTYDQKREETPPPYFPLYYYKDDKGQTQYLLK